MTLDRDTRLALRARAHALAPVVMIGSAGVTDAVLAEIDLALTAHELIKIKIAQGDRSDRATAVERICAAVGAEPVQSIGRVAALYRPAEPRPTPAPRRRRRQT